MLSAVGRLESPVLAFASQYFWNGTTQTVFFGIALSWEEHWLSEVPKSRDKTTEGQCSMNFNLQDSHGIHPFIEPNQSKNCYERTLCAPDKQFSHSTQNN